MRINTSLLSLAIGAFAIGSTEFSPMGMLPDIAGSLAISIPTAGFLIVVYAAGVMIGAPIMTLLLINRSPKLALIFLMAIFTAGNLFSGVSPDFITLMLARFITSLNHGAFFGIGAMVAANVVAKDKQASAIAAMFMGLTIANIGGVPAITWLSQVVGWREAFLLISILGIITMIALLMALPKNMQGHTLNLKKELSVLVRPQVLFALLCTVLGASAMFTLYTYIAPLLMNISAISEKQITIMLVLIGVGFSLGNYIGGKAADYSVELTLIVLFGLLGGSMLVFPLIATNMLNAGLLLVLWGAFSFGVVPPLQIKVMSVAHDAQALASSVNIGAFNLGNALGAALGAGVLSLNLGYAAVSYSGGVVALIGLLLLVLQFAKQHKQLKCNVAV